MGKVDFVVAGASKAGTEWLKLCLDKHPKVHIPRGPAPNYFSYNYDRGDEWYESLFDVPDDTLVVGEKSTSYIIHDDSACRLAKYDSSIDILFVLRDPIERAYSHYKMNLRKGELTDDVDSELNNKSRLVREGLYYQQVSRFCKYLSKDRINVMFFDDLKENPVNFIKSVYSTIGVENDFVPAVATEKYHVTKSRPKFQNLYNSVVSFMRYLQRKSQLACYGIEWLRRSRVVDLFHRLNRGRSFPELSPRRREELSEFYQDDVKRLERFTGRNLSHWC
jgi:hypothetical protein